VKDENGVPHYSREIFDADGVIIDWEGEFLPFAQSLLIHAQRIYDEAKN
jgi:hypothetical protein